MKISLLFERYKSLILPLVFILAFTVLASWPLLRAGFFETHDGEWMVIRLSAFHQSFTDGHFPVRWVERLNHGYGYPVLNFLYPLPFYFGEIFHLVGFSFVDSVKAVFVSSIFFSALFMFIFASRVFGFWGGVAASAFYTFVPYRFVDIYARGSIGESLAFVFIPLIFLTIFELSRKFTTGQIIIGSLAIFGLITSHNVIALLSIFPAVLFGLFQILNRQKSRIVIASYIALILGGLALSCFFWLPALYDLRFVIAPQVQIANVGDHLLQLSQLILPNWGYGPANPKDPSSISFQAGVLHLIFFLISIFVLIKFWKKREFIKIILPIQISLFIYLFLMTDLSAFFWKAFSFASFIQFPWRMLSPVAFLTSLLAAGMLVYIANARQKLIVFLIILVLIALNFSYIRPQNRIFREESYYATNEDTTTVAEEFMPIWVEEPPTQRANSKVEFKQPADLEEEVIKTGNYFFVIHKLQNVTVVVNTVYFPGWKLTIDDKKSPINIEERKGLIRFDLPKDEDARHRVQLTFEETPLRQLSNYISLLSFALLVMFLIYKYLAKSKSNKLHIIVGFPNYLLLVLPFTNILLIKILKGIYNINRKIT